MNLVKHMSSNTTDRACLAYIRQSAFDKRQSLPRVSYTSTMKQIMIFGYLASRGTGKPPHSTLGHGTTPYKKGVVGLWPRG